MNKVRIKSSESKDYLGKSGKGLITSLGLKNNLRSNKCKKSSYAITNVSMKDISSIIKEFEKLPYKSYVRKRPKHKPNDSYFHLARQIHKCMMRSDSFNSDINPVRTEMTGTQQISIFRVCYSYDIKSKEILVDKNSFQVCYTD